MTTTPVLARTPPDPPPPVSPTASRLDTVWLDLARVLAIVAVVAIHAVAPTVGSDTQLGSPAWWAADLIDAGLRWCVPVFVMVSGVLLLAPGAPEAAKPFWARRLRRVGVPLLVWTVVYLAFRVWFFHAPLAPADAARDVASGSPFLHLYFLFVILGLYVLTPYLRVLLRGASHRTAAGLATVCLGLGAADQVLSTLLGSGEPNAATRFLPFVGWFVAGRVLADVSLTPRRVRLAGVALVGAWVVTALGTAGVSALTGHPSAGYLYGFFSPPVLVMSVAAFVLVRAAGTASWLVDSPRRVAVTVRLAAWSFGVYLVHAAVLLPLRRLTGLPTDVGGLLLVTLGLTVATLVLSAAVTAVLVRVPYLRASVGEG